MRFRISRSPCSTCGALFFAISILALAPAPHFVDSRATTVPFDAAFRTHREIVLEENDDVINVMPHLTTTDGGYIITDEREGQVRRYDRDGRLQIYFGNKGQGPGEHNQPMATVPVSGYGPGATMTLAVDGRVSIRSVAGDLLETMTLPLDRVTSVVVTDGKAIVSARQREAAVPPGPLLHQLSLSKIAVERAFGEPELSDELRLAGHFIGWASASPSGDSVATVWSGEPVISIRNADGRVVRKIPLPIEDFESLKPLPAGGASRGEIAAWMDATTLLTQVVWMKDGPLVVQYQSRQNMLPEWHLIVMTADGREMYEVLDAPRLVGVHTGRDSLYFEAPGTLTPNRLVVATVNR